MIVTAKFLVSLLMTALVLFAPPANAEMSAKNITVTVEESSKVHPGMRPPRVHRELNAQPIYADSVNRKGKRYWVEVYNGVGIKEFGVVYRVRDSGRVVVMTAWKNLI